jgi:uncharacterized protein involved in exopolysaccharide biosynthesis
MAPPRSLIGTLAALRLLSTFGRRCAVFGGLIALFTLLSFYPERYRAAASLMPADPQSLGISSALGSTTSTVFGNQAVVEVALRVTNSVYSRNIVIDQLNLTKRLGWSRIAILRWLERNVDIRSLRGGIISIEMQTRDPQLGHDIVAAYAKAAQNRLAQISRQQTAYKRDVLLQLVDDSSRRLAVAQSAYDNFRLRNRAPEPTTAVQAVSNRIPQLEAAAKVKQVELASARQLFTDDNPVVRQKIAELHALEAELAEVKATTQSDDATVGQAVSTSSQLFRLQRDLKIARTLYDNYLTYLQGTAVEDMTSMANMRVLEPAFIDPERQIWWPTAAIAAALLLVWGAVEFYRLRPPVGATLSDREAHVE